MRSRVEAIGPMDVLDHQHHRASLTEALEQGQERFEQASLGPVGGCIVQEAIAVAPEELGDEAPEFAGRRIDDVVDERTIAGPQQMAKGLSDRSEWQPFTQTEARAPPFEHPIAACSA